MACASDEPLQFVMPTPCAWCETEEDVNSFCKDCHQYLCDSCKRLHSKSTYGKNHKVVPFTEGYKIKQENIILCEEHDEPFSVYCRTCRRHICMKCLTSEAHKGHDLIGIEEFGDEVTINVKQELEAKSSECERLLSEITKLNKSNQDFVAKCELGISEIKKNVQTLIDAAKKIESEMIESINRKKSDLSKKYSEKLDEYRSKLNDNKCRITEIDRELQCQSSISVVKFADQAASSLGRIQMPVLPSPPDPEEAVFNPGVLDQDLLRDMIGSIGSKQKLQASILQDKDECKDVLPKTGIVQKKTVEKEVELLYQLAVVKEFMVSKTGRFYDSVWSFCVVNEDTMCVGVSSLIYTNTNKILLVRSDATVIKTITDESIGSPYCLTLADNNEVLVSSCSQQIVRVRLDDSSMSVFATVGEDQRMGNIVTTKDKEFLVAIRDDRKRPILHHLDETGKLKEEIDIGQGLQGDDVGVVDRMCAYLGDEYLVNIEHKIYVLDADFVLREKAVLKEEWKVTEMTSDKYGHIICCDYARNIFVLDQNGHLKKTYKLDMKENDKLFCLLTDKKDNLWFGTWQGGVKISKYLK